MKNLAVLFLSAGLIGCTTTMEAQPERVFEMGEGRPLSFLADEIGDARIVQLGENNHGIAEYSKIKTELVKELHQRHGFSVLAFESDFYQCADVERRLDQLSARGAMIDCLVGVWHTAEVEELFEYILSTRETARPLRIAGFDVQPIGRNKELRPDYLAGAAARVGLDPKRVAEVEREMQQAYGLGSRERRAAWRSDTGERLLRAYTEIAESMFAGGEYEASRVAASLAAYLRQERSPTMAARTEARDEGMAENLLYLANSAYPDSKIITWGHNFHLREANSKIEPNPDMFLKQRARTMGEFLAPEWAQDLFTVGFYARQGKARNNRGQEFEIPPIDAAEIESAALKGRDAPAIWISRQDRSTPDDVTLRYDTQHSLTMSWREQYDALVIVAETTPSGSFYAQ